VIIAGVSRRHRVSSHRTVSRTDLVVATAIACGALLVLAIPAGAAPSVNLRVGDEKQQGGLVWSEWTSGNEHGCVTGFADGTGEFPHPLKVSPARSVRWVLHRRQRPKRVRLHAWNEIDSRENPVGEGADLDFELHQRRHADGGRGAWVARFHAPPDPDSYIYALARWRGDPECGPPRHMLRTYHLATD
jgi:hypothetical protein